MARRWMCAGILAVLMTVVVLMPLARARETSLPKDGNSAAAGKVLVSDVIIQGNQRMTTEQIKVRLRTKAGKEYNPSTVDEDVRELYKTAQFSNILTYVQDDGSGKVKIFFRFVDLPNIVRKITFQGANHIKEEELRNLTGLKTGMPLNPNLNKHGVQRILEKYEEMGRWFSYCKLVKGGEVGDTEIIYAITEGPKVKVRDIQFTGNTFVSRARLVAKMHSSSQWFGFIGGTYNKQMADSDVHELVKFYRAFGYQAANVWLETKELPDICGIALLFHIQEGQRRCHQDVIQTIGAKSDPFEQLDGPLPIKPGDYLDQRGTEKRSPVRIGKIIVSGNKRISSDSIRVHVPLSPGQVLTYPELKQAEKMLAKLGLFVVDPATGVHPTITVIDSENDDTIKDILITIQEKKAKHASAQPR